MSRRVPSRCTGTEFGRNQARVLTQAERSKTFPGYGLGVAGGGGTVTGRRSKVTGARQPASRAPAPRGGVPEQGLTPAAAAAAPR